MPKGTMIECPYCGEKIKGGTFEVFEDKYNCLRIVFFCGACGTKLVQEWIGENDYDLTPEND